MNLFKRLFNPTVKTIYKVLFLVFLTILVTYLVFKTGGTKGAWAQLYFMTIILAAYYWRTVGGLFVAFVMGFIVGPFMPLDVSQGIMQTPENWMIRMLVFMIIGFFAGYILKNVDDINGQMKEKDLIHQSTGLYNTNKLFPILDELFERNEKICLIFFQIRNFEEISKYVHSSIMNNLIQQCILTIQSKYKGNELYSSNYNEFILALNGCNHCEINHSVCEELKDLLKSIQIGNYSFHLIIKVGIAYSDGRHLNSLDLVEKARIAASQGQNFESGVYIYDPAFDQKWRFYYEIAGSIQAAIDQNELYLVYQPIINLNDHSISNVEVLTRWNRGNKKPVSPLLFIKIAEETGQIENITKDIFRKHIDQLLKWEKLNIKIRSSINVSVDELVNPSFIESIRVMFDGNNINRFQFTLEITERISASDRKKLKAVLLNFKAKGCMIAIDDFGTGFNTLIDLIDTGANVIKIDKYFIDRLDDKHTYSLVKNLIKYVHEMNIRVIAEGVETQKQLLMLKDMECDMIQGYYFSKPILANEFCDYYQSFGFNSYIE